MRRIDVSWGGLVALMFSVVAMVIVTQATGRADGFRNPPEGAAVLGRASARLTEGDDLTAITHNPANLMDLKQAGVLPTVTIGYSKRKYTAPNGLTEESKAPWTVLPGVYAGMPLEGGKYAVGVGVNVPYGQGSEWDQDGLFKYRAPYFARMRSVNANSSMAMRLGKDIAVGAGVDLMWSDLEFRQSLMGPMGPMGPSSRMIFEGSGVGFGGNVGLTWSVTSNQRLAVTYRSPMTVNYEGDFTMEDSPPPGARPPWMTSSSDFETEVDFPSVAALGYGVHLTKAFRVEANVEWVEHSRNQAMDVDIQNNNPILGSGAGSTSLPQSWKDTWAYGVGADYALCSAAMLRCGWFHLPSPVPEETLTPTLAEGDKEILSIGLGLKAGRQTVDLAYAYNLCSDRTIDSPANPINGKYEFEAHLFAVSYGLTF